MTPPYPDLEIGQRFGKLVVTGPKFLAQKPNGGKETRYPVLCDCGETAAFTRRALATGNNRSCGCMKHTREGTSVVKHGYAGTRLYRIWASMKNRCSDPALERYGGRGITVCTEWQDFIPFKDWALSTGYEDGLELDRINTNGNYEPSNCRWITRLGNLENRAVYLNVEDEQWVRSFADSHGRTPYTVIKIALDAYLTELGYPANLESQSEEQ